MTAIFFNCQVITLLIQPAVVQGDLRLWVGEKNHCLTTGIRSVSCPGATRFVFLLGQPVAALPRSHAKPHSHCPAARLAAEQRRILIALNDMRKWFDKIYFYRHNTYMKPKFVVIPFIIVFMSCAGIQNTKKGDICLDLSIPYVNSFFIAPESEGDKINTGFWGFGIGVDYYHSDNQFLNLGVSGAIDFFLPIPAAVDPLFEDGTERELLGSVNFFLTNNHRMNIVTIGYGFYYAIIFWNYSYYNYSGTPDLPQTFHTNKNHGTFGLIFPVSILYKNFIGGKIVYKPTFYRPYLTDKFTYEHLISIEFVYKLRVYNAEKN